MENLCITAMQKKDEQPLETLIKFLLVGDPGVGKSSLAMHFTHLDRLSAEEIRRQINGTQPTVGMDMGQCQLLDPSMGQLRFWVWDMAGAERFQKPELVGSFYRGKEAVLFVFDLTDARTFTAIYERWYDRVQAGNQASWRGMLVGNKCDREAERQVSVEQAQGIADRLDMEYVELSARESEADLIRYPFLRLASQLYQDGVVRPQQRYQASGPVESSCCQ